MRVLFASMAILLSVVPARAAIRLTYPIEYAVERAELVVIGQRGAVKGAYSEFPITQVFVGSGVNAGDTILVHRLGEYQTSYSRDRFREKNPVEMKDKPHLLCLAQKADYAKKNSRHFEFDTTGYGSAIKILDGEKVYGYYQFINPGPYQLAAEQCTKEQLLKRIPRAVELGKKWANVKAVTDKTERDAKMLDFLMDRTLPSHFCGQACYALRGAKLVAIIADEVKQAKPLPSKLEGRDEGWSRLWHALRNVEEDGKELLPLLWQVTKKRPDEYEQAVYCAIHNCGPAAIPFFKQALLDRKATHHTAARLAEIGTPEARAALEEVLDQQLQKPADADPNVTRRLAQKWPAAWSDLAEKLHRDRGSQAEVKKYLDESWRSLVREQAVKIDHVPRRYTAAFEPLLKQLGSQQVAIRESATRQFKALLRDSEGSDFVRAFLRRAAHSADDTEVRRRAGYLIEDADHENR
ncbi:MAG: hypothetical protein HYR84_07420 [Planctomycetes bacterium]|nr:hypothetical protein [Planctomycetota bacterium]